MFSFQDEATDYMAWYVRNYFAPETDLLDPVIFFKLAVLYLKTKLGFA